jgi:hypothetical protein
LASQHFLVFVGLRKSRNPTYHAVIHELHEYSPPAFIKIGTLSAIETAYFD